MSARTDALWHPQAHMPSVLRDPLVIVRGDGAYVNATWFSGIVRIAPRR